MIAVARRPERHYVDFAHVPVSQWKIHDRLENWARSCRGSQKQSGTAGSPIFRLSRSSDAKSIERLYGELTSVPIDIRDAARLGAAVGALPEKHRRAIHWYYLRGKSPAGFAMQLMVPLARLAEMVIEARAKLIETVSSTA